MPLTIDISNATIIDLESGQSPSYGLVYENFGNMWLRYPIELHDCAIWFIHPALLKSVMMLEVALPHVIETDRILKAPVVYRADMFKTVYLVDLSGKIEPIVLRELDAVR